MSNAQTNNNNKKEKGKERSTKMKAKSHYSFQPNLLSSENPKEKPSRNVLSYWRMTLTRMWWTEEFFLTEWPIQGSLLAEADPASEDTTTHEVTKNTRMQL